MEAIDESKSAIKIRLYVDDVRKCPIGWTVARSVKEAQLLFQKWTVEEASLDYDLGACRECIVSDPQAASTLHCPHIPDGLALVQWMVDTSTWPESKPVVHSANKEGRVKMRELIDQHYPMGSVPVVNEH